MSNGSKPAKPAKPASSATPAKQETSETSLRFSPGDPRVRVLNSKPPAAKGEFVLYFCQIFRRADDNAALEYAIARANELGVPCVVYQSLRPDYPFASDRFHTFVLEGARDMEARLEARGIRHLFFLPRTPAEARGKLAQLASRASLVVSDDSPAFIVPQQNAALAARAPCTYVVIDDCAVVPLSLFPKEEFAARTLRPKFHRVKDQWLLPLHSEKPRVASPSSLEVPFELTRLASADIPSLVASCDIDHAVGAVSEFPGGQSAAEERLARFLRRKMGAYAADRNEPSRDATSHLSPYLHFGMISARRVALEVQAWAAEHGPNESSEGFLEQLLVRRGLAYNFANCNRQHQTYESIPAWAKTTLEDHRNDKRPSLVTREQLERAASPDEVWNAAQLELRTRGVVHNYVRMLWGKLPITWFADPQQAFETLVYLNDKYALDGRDPDGYASIAWCFGLHDRPWPTHPCFGKVRTMTSKSARSKLDLDGYLSQARQWRGALT
jgi:deoxyribodipyrimidine photo-lyase